MRTYATESISVGVTAVGLTASNLVLPENSQRPGAGAEISVIGAPIMFSTLQGTDPTSTTGQYVAAGNRVILDNTELKAFKAISYDGNTATLNVEYKTDI